MIASRTLSERGGANGELDGWAWAPEPAPPELVERFERAIGAWDRHIGDCRECLHQGRWFCAEGEELTRRVGAARAGLAGPSKPPRTLSLSIVLGRWFAGQVTATAP